jgi:hypothetical protein
MSKIPVILFFLFASPVCATTYYLATAATGGSDSNNGLSPEAPWLTPNHALSCGDVILAAAGTYAYSNFGAGNWGTVTCSSPGVAWLKCATFDACVISAGNNAAMDVTSSYWGVQGWQLGNSATTTNGADCLDVNPPFGSGTTIHHIIIANNVISGCGANGINSFNFATGSTGYGVDYLAIVGNWVYGATASNVECYSGISVYEPINSDTLSGTHIYIAGNLVNDTVNPTPCQGGPPNAGNGIVLDTWDGSGEGLSAGYSGQGVIDNNILIFNGYGALQSYLNSANPPNSQVYVRQNTAYGNGNGPNLASGTACAQFMFTYHSNNVQVFNNIADSNTGTGCGGNPLYDYYFSDAFNSLVYNTIGYSVSGSYAGSSGDTNVTYASSYQSGVNPNFSNPIDPGAPSCGTASSVPNCMATVISNFTPTNASAVGYGYQKPSATPTSDPLFPQWLCNVNLPAALVTMGCQ